MTSPPILAVLDGSYWLLPSERCLAEQDTVGRSKTFLSDEESHTWSRLVTYVSIKRSLGSKCWVM
jgi:hypothetical protein